MAAEMLRAHYVLQALLYAVALHRYLRWRQPGYDPQQHLGGVQYLFVRGMVGRRHRTAAGSSTGSRRCSWCWTCPTCWPAREGRRATGLLAVFNQAGVLAAADVHVARRLGSLARESDEPVLLATALAVRAVRLGATCLELDRLADVPLEEDADVDPAALPWPAVQDVVAGLRRSPLVVGSPVGTLCPLVLVDTDAGRCSTCPGTGSRSSWSGSPSTTGR
jgi:hypothetical protein